MQHSPTAIFQLIEQQNQCPDCLYIELAELPGPPSAPGTAQIDLHLTIKFGEQWQTLPGGSRVKFGLTGGTLQLHLDNGKLLASGALAGAFESDMGRVTKSGSSYDPSWIFTTTIGATILRGTIETVQLGRLQVISRPCLLEAAFAISAPDLYLTDAEGLWPHDISPNKHAVLERKLVHVLIETKLAPYLSWVQWCYECPNPTPSIHLPDNENTDRSLQDFHALIARLSHAETDHFLKLAKLASLNPNYDFAGGNLLGTNLSGLDLTGINLSRTNLRGADFSDADLSEANLTHAKLSGADLSGAYLSETDLSQTDLHKASLALANLSGADLRDANLKDANLSRTNLSGAKVENARFGNNPGLPDEMKPSLKRRGAIFEDL